MTRYRKLDPRTGSIPYRDKWGRAPIRRRRRRDDLDLTWRDLAWAFLPALGVVAGAWIALVWAWTL